MADIKLKLVIKTAPEKVYEAITTQEGLASWWCKQTTAQSQVGFTNTFIFGNVPNEMKVTELVPSKKVEWKCINSNGEWINTNLSFDLEEKNGHTILRFAHSDWEAPTDFFAACNYAWGSLMTSLKSFCETGNGTPS